jgi:hypothetical protein
MLYILHFASSRDTTRSRRARNRAGDLHRRRRQAVQNIDLGLLVRHTGHLHCSLQSQKALCYLFGEGSANVTKVPWPSPRFAIFNEYELDDEFFNKRRKNKRYANIDTAKVANIRGDPS